jgi:hypothetical protein
MARGFFLALVQAHLPDRLHVLGRARGDEHRIRLAERDGIRDLQQCVLVGDLRQPPAGVVRPASSRTARGPHPWNGCPQRGKECRRPCFSSNIKASFGSSSPGQLRHHNNLNACRVLIFTFGQSGDGGSGATSVLGTGSIGACVSFSRSVDQWAAAFAVGAAERFE